MAQQVEHILGKDEVTGSNPVSSSTNPLIGVGFFYAVTVFSPDADAAQTSA